MKYISLDSSTKCTGWAIFNNCKLVNYGLIDCSNEKDTEKRINNMGKQVLDLLNNENPDIVSAEHPQGQGRNVLVVNKLSEVIGIIRGYTIQNNKPFFEIMPSEWRKYCGLKQGKKKRAELKQMSIDYIRDIFGIETTDDVCDAICQGYGFIMHCNNEEKEN